MPKKGMTAITFRTEIAELLRTKAKQAGMGLNEFLETTLIGPSQPLQPTTSGPSQDRPRTVLQDIEQRITTVPQALNQQSNPNQAPTEFSLNERSLFPKRESSVVRAPRFEPGSSAWQADVLDQTRLRPQVAHSAEDTSQMFLFCFSKHGSARCLKQYGMGLARL